MRAVLRLVRTPNLVVSFAGTVVGGLAALAAGVRLAEATWLALGLAGLSTACVTAAGNVLNDLGDLEGDRTNHPDRPLVTGEVRLGSARALTAALFVAGAVLVVPVVPTRPWVGVILAVAVAGLLAYELRWKARGLVGNLTVGGLTAMVFLYGGAAAGAPEIVLPFAAMAFLATVSREVIKDMEDVRGDVGRRTLPQAHGMQAAAAVARGTVAGAIALSAVPFLWFLSLPSLAGVAYGLVVAGADAIFVLSVVWLPSRLRLEQSVSKGAMALALCAFLAVAFR